MRGNNIFEFSCCTSRGKSEGILSMWVPNAFQKERVVCTENMVIFEGKWDRNNFKCSMVNVYASQDPIKNRNFGTL